MILSGIFFLTRYHGPRYLPYQIIYRVGKSKKLWYAILSHLLLLMGLMYCSPLVIYMNISNSIWMEGHLLVTVPARTLFFFVTLTSGRKSELKTETARDSLTVFKCKIDVYFHFVCLLHSRHSSMGWLLCHFHSLKIDNILYGCSLQSKHLG